MSKDLQGEIFFIFRIQVVVEYLKKWGLYE